ncbi:Alpha/Beta hydrolase protein [Chytridium lagenaria]|nr:Alpha/Beta hydrolase protein [Chytridium lagenaria]
MGVWPELRAYEMVLAGESFAGVYIPYFADALLKKLDQPGSVKAPKYNLKGLMIGNGMMDPLRQYIIYIDYALEKQIIGSPYLEKARESEAICREYLEKTEHLRFKTCHDILTIILDYSKKSRWILWMGEPWHLTLIYSELPCRNRYDVRLRDPDGETGHCGLSAWPPRLLDLTEYMSREDVRTAVHADKRGDEGKGKPWLECNLGTVTALADDASQPSYKLLPDILSRIPVTLFTGDQDLVCNVIGVSRMIKNLKWNGGQGMEASPLQNWFILNDVHSNKDVRKQNIGTVQTRSNLTNIVVFGASHMASVDFPYITRALVERVVLGLGTLDETSLIKEIGVDSNNEDGFVSMLEVARAEIAPVSVWAMMLYIVLIFAVMALAIYALLVVGSKLGFLGEIPIPSVEPILRKLLSFVKTTRQPNEWHELSENEYEDIFHQEDLGQVPDQSTSSGFNFRHTRENQLREAQLERERNARLT